jgi:hypothetical protein
VTLIRFCPTSALCVNPRIAPEGEPTIKLLLLLLLLMLFGALYRVIKKSMCTWVAMENSLYSSNPHTIDDLKMAITEYIWNVDRAILNMVFENTVRRVNKCLETGGGHFDHYL